VTLFRCLSLGIITVLAVVVKQTVGPTLNNTSLSVSERIMADRAQ